MLWCSDIVNCATHLSYRRPRTPVIRRRFRGPGEAVGRRGHPPGVDDGGAAGVVAALHQLRQPREAVQLRVLATHHVSGDLRPGRSHATLLKLNWQKYSSHVMIIKLTAV